MKTTDTYKTEPNTTKAWFRSLFMTSGQEIRPILWLPHGSLLQHLGLQVLKNDLCATCEIQQKYTRIKYLDSTSSE